MLLSRIRASKFLSFEELDLTLEPDLTIITGPNGAGKTNVGRCLDIVRSVMEHISGNPKVDSLHTYLSAGRDGSPSFDVALDITLDQPWEKSLVQKFIQAAFSTGTYRNSELSTEIDMHARNKITLASVAPLWSGRLKIHFDAMNPAPWSAAWEFEHCGEKWIIYLHNGPREGYLHSTSASPSEIAQKSRIEVADFLLDRSIARNPRELLTHTINIEEIDLSAALVKFPDSLIDLVCGAVSPKVNLPLSLMELATELDMQPYEHGFQFGKVIACILRRATILTANRRVPTRRTFGVGEMNSFMDLRDGSNIGMRLFQLKNGSATQRETYAAIEHTFTWLTNRKFGLRTSHAASEKAPSVTIEPTVITPTGEIPLELSGAGIEEVAVLSTLLAGPPGRFFLLDEPAVHLEPTMQRRAMSAFRKAGQSLIITHSPDMVPVSGIDDLRGIVRLAPGPKGPLVKRISDVSDDDLTRWLQLLEPTHVRALLFASRVILCEGSTEVGALAQWWQDTAGLGLPDPEAANIPIITVNGDKAFGGYIDYLDAFGVPWAVVADGPALLPDSVLARCLKKKDRPAGGQPTREDFAEWKAHWARAGVFTLADEFGNDRDKQGEFEAFLDRTNPQLFEQAKKEWGRSKPQVGRFFAMRQARPKEIDDLYIAIMNHFGNS
ncbi:AAA family ATPase [Herbidospora sp. RD11066]